MRIVLQRVSYASCKVDGNITGEIENGFLALIGFKKDDDKSLFEKMAKKVAGLRVFSDSEGKMNLDIKKIGGKILAISQFTLYADSKHGNRPSFIDAMEYDKANQYYMEFVSYLENTYDIKTSIQLIQQLVQFGGECN